MIDRIQCAGDLLCRQLKQAADIEQMQVAEVDKFPVVVASLKGDMEQIHWP